MNSYPSLPFIVFSGSVSESLFPRFLYPNISQSGKKKMPNSRHLQIAWFDQPAVQQLNIFHFTFNYKWVICGFDLQRTNHHYLFQILREFTAKIWAFSALVHAIMKRKSLWLWIVQEKSMSNYLLTFYRLKNTHTKIPSMMKSAWYCGLQPPPVNMWPILGSIMPTSCSLH